jgi:hypothetical protein
MKISYIYLVITLVTLTMASCTDEKIDNEKPVISFNIPSEKQYVLGTIKLVGTVTDNSEVKTVQVLVDGILLKEISGGLIDIEWNTELVEDGVHIVEIHAIDNSNNESISSTELKVLNTYLTFSVAQDCVPNNFDLWVFVSRADGSIPSIQRVENGVDIKLVTPIDFDITEKIAIHRFVHYEDPLGQNSYSLILSFTNSQAGNYVLKNQSKRVINTGDGKYRHYVKITDVPSYKGFSASGLHVAYGAETNHKGNIFEGTLMLREPVSDAFIALETGDVDMSCARLESVRDQDTTRFNFSDLLPMESKELPESKSIDMDAMVEAVPSPGDYDNAYPIWHDSGYPDESVRYRYPKNLYPEYIFSASTAFGSVYNFQSVVSDIPPETFTEVDAVLTNMTFTDHALTISATGSYDYFIARAGIYSAQDVHWDVYSADTNVKISLPDLPSTLRASYRIPLNSAFKFYSATFVDYSNIGGYDDFLNFQFNSNASAESTLKKYNAKIFLPDLSTGRKSHATDGISGCVKRTLLYQASVK